MTDLKHFLKESYCNYTLNKSDIDEELIFNEQNLREELELYNKDGSEITHNYNFNTSIAKIKTLHNGNIYAYRNLNIIE